jgi:hypothetical protein
VIKKRVHSNHLEVICDAGTARFCCTAPGSPGNPVGKAMKLS